MKKLIVLLMCCLALGGCGSNNIETSQETTIASQTKSLKTESETVDELYYDENDNKEYPTADQLLTALKGKSAYMLEIQVFDEETDPNGSLGKPGKYISKANFSDARVQENEENLSAGTIEVFRSVKECHDRASYLRGLSKPGKDLVKQYIYEYNQVLFRISHELSEEQAEEYHQQMNDIITEWEKNGKIDLSGSSILLEKESVSPNDDVINQVKELYKAEAESKLSYSKENSDSCFEVVLKSSKELAKSTSGASAEEMVNNILFNPFVTAAGYLCNNYKEDTDYGKVGNMAFDLLGFIIIGDNENIDKILNEYDEIAAKYGMTIVTLEETEKQTEESKESQTQEPIELSTGNYVVGEDIPAGKYDIIGIKRGNVRVCSQGNDYGDVLSEIIKPDETVYANVKLVKGYTLEIVNGGKIQLQPK